MRQPAPALERQFDLPHARRERARELGEGPPADDPVHGQAMALLESLDGADQLRTDDRVCRHRLVRWQVSERDQQPPQLHGPRIGGAGLQGPALEWRKPVQSGIEREFPVADQGIPQQAVMGEWRLDGVERCLDRCTGGQQRQGLGEVEPGRRHLQVKSRGLGRCAAEVQVAEETDGDDGEREVELRRRCRG